MTDPVPEIPVTSVRRAPWGRVSLVWLVPLAAVLVAGGVAWRTLAQRGPLIEIVFDDAGGIAAQETELRFREVTVGLVESVRFSDGLEKVVVSVRLDDSVAPYVDADAQFWVVEPVVTTQGVTGIETVLTGRYIEGVWDAMPEGLRETHQGRATPPLLVAGQEGLTILLRSSQGALTSEMPLLFQGVQVGQVGEPRVSEDGLTVEADAVVYAPYDALVTQSTRFWDASGFRLSLGTSGADVAFDSLSSLIVGGLAFEEFVADAPPAQDGDVFIAYYDEDQARESVFAGAEDGPTLSLQATFSGDVAGLAEGAGVELDGLRIGEVTTVTSRIDPADGGVRVRAVLAIQPARLALDAEGQAPGGPEGVLDFLARQVAEEGLRARLATADLLGGLEVQLVEVADAAPAAIDRDAEPFPALPTTDNDIADIAATAQGAIERIDALPIEELLQSAIGFLDNASVLVGSADTQGIPGEVRGLLSDLRGVAGAPEVQALPDQLQATLSQVDSAVADLRGVLADIEEAQAVSRLLTAVDRAGLAAEQVGAATAGVPALVERLDALAVTANELPVEALVAELTSLATSADALVSAPGTQALPADLSAALSEAEALLREAREGGVVTNANAALAAARTAAEGLPGLVAEAEAVLDQAAAAVQTLGDGSGVVAEAEAAIREVADAAQAVADLARAIERDPNSLIFGD